VGTRGYASHSVTIFDHKFLYSISSSKIKFKIDELLILTIIARIQHFNRRSWESVYNL